MIPLLDPPNNSRSAMLPNALLAVSLGWNNDGSKSAAVWWAANRSAMFGMSDAFTDGLIAGNFCAVNVLPSCCAGVCAIVALEGRVDQTSLMIALSSAPI